jgi:galactokinase/mevalonate kinase-like predicted kinase
MFQPWDYLIVTASNDSQAAAYRRQLDLRCELGLLPDIGQVLVVADLEGRRIGSGGSTLLCLMEVLSREIGKGGVDARDWEALQALLAQRRILIIHAGGDSRRLPAYGPCGKIFVPVPGESDSALGAALFDRQLPIFMGLPASPRGRGQVVVTSGDALILFESGQIPPDERGITALGCLATPEAASKHGVFCANEQGHVRIYLQKPKVEEQISKGAVNRFGQSVLDIGVMSFDAASAVALLKAFEVEPLAASDAGPQSAMRFGWSPAMRKLILDSGLDWYREICCALGSEATVEHHLASVRDSGSKWPKEKLAALFKPLARLPFHLRQIPQCHFLHFGTTRQLISSGQDLTQFDRGVSRPGDNLLINHKCVNGGVIAGGNSWLEACRVAAPLTLGGGNVLVGVDVNDPLDLPAGACVDVLAGKNRRGDTVHFYRLYHSADTFKDTTAKGGTLAGRPLLEWLSLAGLNPAQVWDSSIPENQRSLWDARVFPAQAGRADFQQWLWMFDPAQATPKQKQSLAAADRYSVAEMAILADQEAFYQRRAQHRAEEIRHSLKRLFRRDSGFSARELAFALEHAEDKAAWLAELIGDAHFQMNGGAGAGMGVFVSCRILHSMASAIMVMAETCGGQPRVVDIVPGLTGAITPALAQWMATLGLEITQKTLASEWTKKVTDCAFEQIGRTILISSLSRVSHPRNALRSGETVWGRAPARLELGGGWTDTPPYTLEYGGSVINTAVNLNGQPPIHCYGRVIQEPVIRLFSIEAGLHVQIDQLKDLLDYRNPRDIFGLVKAALAISGFSSEMADWPANVTLRQMLEEFGGGIELTTLTGIPTGSGLGTSSIVGTVLVGVINRMLGRPLSQRELFHNVLRLEQALTTGGGWQDQIGGGVGGSKLTTTLAGLFPDPNIHYVPDDVIDSRLNGGSTLLYYTGITRLAKNILRQIVGDYLDRNRATMSCLAQEHQVSRNIMEAMSRKDPEAFGRHVDEAWRLQKELCSEVTNPSIERLLAMIRPHIHGARILGAGSGGFMLMICKSPGDAAEIREKLLREPLNERSRFFDFSVNDKGLEVTTC